MPLRGEFSMGKICRRGAHRRRRLIEEAEEAWRALSRGLRAGGGQREGDAAEDTSREMRRAQRRDGRITANERDARSEKKALGKASASLLARDK